MKAHIGTDAQGRVHNLTATSMVADCTQFDQRLHEEETVALGDPGCDYPGLQNTTKA